MLTMTKGWPHETRSPRQQPPSRSRLPERLQRLLGALVAAAGAYLITRQLAALPSTFLAALLLAGGSILSGRAIAPWAWGAVLGAGCGGLLGSAMVVGEKIQSTNPHEGLNLRLALLA
jgi:hypothetical protein